MGSFLSRRTTWPWLRLAKTERTGNTKDALDVLEGDKGPISPRASLSCFVSNGDNDPGPSINEEVPFRDVSPASATVPLDLGDNDDGGSCFEDDA